MMNRTLVAKPICAKLTIDTELFGKMDPYVKMSLGGQQFKTKTAHGMGKNPTWQDSFSFNHTNE